MYTQAIPSQTFPHNPSIYRHPSSHPVNIEPISRIIPNGAFRALFQFINAFTDVDLSDEELFLISANLKLKRLRKRQYFLQEGDVCKYIGFIVKGCTRTFSINERGQESVISFGLENSWVVDLESFTKSDCSSYHIEVLEETELLLLSLDQLNYLKRHIPAVAEMFCQYQEQQLISMQQRINAALSMTAEERYFDLLQQRPEYAQRFSQNMIACYLGVKPETLSRIRKR